MRGKIPKKKGSVEDPEVSVFDMSTGQILTCAGLQAKPLNARDTMQRRWQFRSPKRKKKYFWRAELPNEKGPSDHPGISVEKLRVGVNKR